MSENRLVLHNTTYFDSVKGKMEEGRTIVLKNGMIDWIGDYSSFEKEENDEVLELTGKYALPGLIDCHVHLQFGRETGQNPFDQYMTTETAYYAYTALRSAQEHLRSGFTTVRDCGGDNWAGSIRRAFASGLFKGPRVLASQAPITQFGHKDESLPDDLKLAFTLLHRMKLVGTNYPTGVDEMVYAVRERLAFGSDFIKVLNTGSVYGVGSKVERVLFREEEMKALVEESHRNGVQVACHSHPDRGIQEALAAGVDTIEHGTYMSEETASTLAKTDIYLIPTHLVFELDLDMMKEYPGFKEKMVNIIKAVSENHNIAYEKGVKMALGTDSGAGGAAPGESAKELGLMVRDVRMTPVQALQCATINAARALWLEDSIGSIEVGKAGDIVVVSSNPLDDITTLENMENIELVIRNAERVAERGLLIP